MYLHCEVCAKKTQIITIIFEDIASGTYYQSFSTLLLALRQINKGTIGMGER